MRGIGRYISSLLAALTSEQAAWAEQHLRPVITATDRAPAAGRPIVTRRLIWRRQDLGWLMAWVADRMVVGRARLSLWHSLDPTMPLSPLPARRTLMTAYDLIALHEPVAMAQIRAHRRPLHRLYLRRLRTARLVIAISEVTARDLRVTLGVAADRIRIVYPAVSLPPPPPQPVGIGAPFDLLFVGVPSPTKQTELAVAALTECRRRGHQVRLCFVGYQRPADRNRLAALASASGAGDSIEFLGQVDDGRLTELYRRSVLLAVSRSEGFGLPPLEALMAGGRAVCATAPVYREVLGDAADYAASFDGKGLADAYEAAISRAVEGPPPALVERFSQRATAAALVAAYESALDGLPAH